MNFIAYLRNSLEFQSSHKLQGYLALLEYYTLEQRINEISGEPLTYENQVMIYKVTPPLLTHRTQSKPSAP